MISFSQNKEGVALYTGNLFLKVENHALSVMLHYARVFNMMNCDMSKTIWKRSGANFFFFLCMYRIIGETGSTSSLCYSIEVMSVLDDQDDL